LWTRRAWFPVADFVAHGARAYPGADPHTFAVMDRLAVPSGFYRIALSDPDAGCDRHAVTQAYRSPDATPDRGPDRTSHGRPDATADREADATPNATADREAHADADAAAEQARPARLADE
jgi:hypothetical protein